MELNQPVNVVKGKHTGTKGNVCFYRTEGDGGRITLLSADGSHIYVDKDEIDFKFDSVSITLMMTDDERAEFDHRLKGLEKNLT